MGDAKLQSDSDKIDFTVPTVTGLQIFCPTLNQYTIVQRNDFAMSSYYVHYLVRCGCGVTHKIEGVTIPQKEIDKFFKEINEPTNPKG